MSAPAGRFDRMDVTPFIDVLLVLLILFMMVARVPERSLAGELPGARVGSGPAALRVRVGPRGSLWLDGEPLAGPTGLQRALRERLTQRRQPVVLVEVEDGVGYADVVAAIDAAEGAGAQRIGLVGGEAASNSDAAEAPR